VRGLYKRPLFAVAAVITLALGIGIARVPGSGTGIDARGAVSRTHARSRRTVAEVIGRLKHGVTRSQAPAEFDAIASVSSASIRTSTAVSACAWCRCTKRLSVPAGSRCSCCWGGWLRAPHCMREGREPAADTRGIRTKGAGDSGRTRPARQGGVSGASLLHNVGALVDSPRPEATSAHRAFIC
jgi:hypothetical protein